MLHCFLSPVNVYLLSNFCVWKVEVDMEWFLHVTVGVRRTCCSAFFGGIECAGGNYFRATQAAHHNFLFNDSPLCVEG